MVDMILKINATVINGFIYSIVVRFSKTDSQAFLEVWDDPDTMVLNNLIKKEILDASLGSEGIFKAVATNQPKTCSLQKSVLWVLLDENNVNHLETIMAEVTYFDGVAFHMLAMPTQLGVTVP
jgi:hypothetical protein